MSSTAEVVSWPPLEPRFERYTVTPEIARTWLQSNTHNRKITRGVVDKYAAAMRLGQWRCAMADTITFDSQGVLQEGQHRLHAVVQADLPVEFWVAFGANPDDFHVIGSGKRRSVSDVLGMEGKTNTTTRGAAARQVLMYRIAPHRVWNGQVAPSWGITDQSVIDEALRPEYDDCSTYLHRVRSGGPLITPTTSLAHAVLVMEFSDFVDELDEFYLRLVSGAGLEIGNPILTLRNWYMGDSTGKGQPGGTWIAQRKLAIHVRAWNAWVSGEQLKQLKFNQQNLPMPGVK